MLNNTNIIQRLKEIEITIQNSTYKPPYLNQWIKGIGDIGYKPIHTEYELFNGIKDIDKLEFSNKQEILDFLYDRADKLNIPKRDVNKPMLIEIVDNSHLEKMLYNANK